MKSNEVIEVSKNCQLYKDSYGGDWYGLKYKGKIVDLMLFRDCRHLGNGCDYEWVMYSDNKENGLCVNPIDKSFFSRSEELFIGLEKK